MSRNKSQLHIFPFHVDSTISSIAHNHSNFEGLYYIYSMITNDWLIFRHLFYAQPFLMNQIVFFLVYLFSLDDICGESRKQTNCLHLSRWVGFNFIEGKNRNYQKQAGSQLLLSVIYIWLGSRTDPRETKLQVIFRNL